MTTPSSVPAQGEAMEDLALLVRLCDRMADEGGGSMYHPDTLAQRNAVVRRLREWIESASRALVAASPCEAEPDWPAGWPESWKRLPRESLQRLRDDPPCGHMLRGVRKDYCARCQRAAIAPARAEATTAILDKVEHLLCVASDAGKAEAAGDAATTERLDMELKRGVEAIEQALVAAAQGGQQPVAEWQWRQWWNGDGGEPMGWGDWQRVKPRNRLQSLDEAVQEMRDFIAQGCRYELRPLYAAPAPAAPLTAEQIHTIADIGSAPLNRDGMLYRFARAIESACAAKWGITLAGTAQKESADGR